MSCDYHMVHLPLLCYSSPIDPKKRLVKRVIAVEGEVIRLMEFMHTSYVYTMYKHTYIHSYVRTYIYTYIEYLQIN